MYTNCPECGTVFRISTTELRVAEGYVRCGHCSATFNALATLADQLPPTVTLQQLTLPTEADPSAAVGSETSAPESEPEAGPEVPAHGGLPAEPERPSAPPRLEAAATYVPLPVSEDTLEFDIPEDKWSNFFAGNTPSQDSVPATPLEAEAETAADSTVAAQTDVGQGIGSDTVDQAGLYRALNLEAREHEEGDAADWQALLAEVPDDEASPAPVYVISEDDPREASPAAPLPEPAWDDPPEEAQAPAPLPADFAVDLPDAPDSGSERWSPAESQGEPQGEPPAELPTADRPFLWTPPAAPKAPSSGRGWVYTAGSALLVLVLVMQVLHQQRDELATNPALTEPLQRLYATLGLPLWPAWDLQAYQVRNSEAVADRSSRGALDILARIAVVGDKPVGLPLVRVTLRDGRTKPLGSRVFQPAEYLGTTPRPREPVSPGTLIPVEISLKDPGRDALGFDVDVCVMSRREGLLCRSEREPFSR